MPKKFKAVLRGTHTGIFKHEDFDSDYIKIPNCWFQGFNEEHEAVRWFESTTEISSGVVYYGVAVGRRTGTFKVQLTKGRPDPGQFRLVQDATVNYPGVKYKKFRDEASARAYLEQHEQEQRIINSSIVYDRLEEPTNFDVEAPPLKRSRSDDVEERRTGHVTRVDHVISPQNGSLERINDLHYTTEFTVHSRVAHNGVGVAVFPIRSSGSPPPDPIPCWTYVPSPSTRKLQFYAFLLSLYVIKAIPGVENKSMLQKEFVEGAGMLPAPQKIEVCTSLKDVQLAIQGSLDLGDPDIATLVHEAKGLLTGDDILSKISIDVRYVPALNTTPGSEAALAAAQLGNDSGTVEGNELYSEVINNVIPSESALRRECLSLGTAEVKTEKEEVILHFGDSEDDEYYACYYSEQDLDLDDEMDLTRG
ncbi:hypothetical protein GEMRC1_008412 [Eukaryota sp. GEM-RC1]